MDNIVYNPVCGPCALNEDSVRLYCARRATRAAISIVDIVNQIAVDGDVMNVTIGGTTTSDRYTAASVRAAICLDVMDGVVCHIHVRTGHVDAKVITCR